jgi:hypothetical protein
MPYVKQERRLLLIKKTSEFKEKLSPGDLNYQITFLIQNYIDQNKMSYQTINDIVGALEGAKLEFYRRVAAPYEDKKISENGDVYYVEGVTTAAIEIGDR